MSCISLAQVLAQVRGKQTFFAGTNIFYILLRQTADDPLGFTDDGVTAYLSAQVYIPSLLLHRLATAHVVIDSYCCLLWQRCCIALPFTAQIHCSNLYSQNMLWTGMLLANKGTAAGILWG